ncbi:MAG: Xaa-Pro dipeptidyl-peptidase, partial [Longimicrobiales bacterium]|nr:Xaa-Pro dipeptidyl-peptidase [Longimicrobiales bacterium]
MRFRPHPVAAPALLAAPVLLLALGAPPAAGQSAGGGGGGAGAVGPVFENGMAQVVPAFADSTRWIREELWVETDFDSDGDGRRDRVRVSVVRPGPTEDGLRVPVVYESSPYYSGTSGVGPFFWDPRQEVGGAPNPRNPHPPAPHRPRPGISGSHVGDWVPRGFAVVHSEAPGTGLSQGCPTVGGDPEALAPKAVIDWLNGRAKGFTAPEGGDEVRAEWSTGKVGMTGTSYNGTIPFAAATTGVEGLEAIIPVAPNTSYYRYYRTNGLVRSPGGYIGEDMDVLYDFIHSQDPARRGVCDARVREGELRAGQDRVTGDFNAFWEARDFMLRTDGVRAATLMAHAFNDWNVMPEHSVRVYEALKARGVPAMAYYHQGGHGGPPPRELMNRWFTRYLYGVENGVEQMPRAWIVREGAERGDPTPYADYPNPDAAPVTVYPRPGGVQHGDLVLSPAPAAPGGAPRTETLEDNFSFSGRTLALAEWSDHRLLYVTPELQADVHVSGWPSVTLRAASDREAANLSVWLVQLPWTEGRNATGGVVTRGWADLRNHRALSRRPPADLAAAALHRVTDHRAFTGEAPLEPGRFYDVTFELNPDDQVLPAGSRLGLLVFSTDREFTLWPDPGTRLTLDLDGVSLTLPIVGGRPAL